MHSWTGRLRLSLPDRYYSSDAELVRLFKSVNGLILPVRIPPCTASGICPCTDTEYIQCYTSST